MIKSNEYKKYFANGVNPYVVSLVCKEHMDNNFTFRFLDKLYAVMS